MILPASQLDELRRRIKVNNIPNWTSIPGLDSQINSLKALLVDVFLRKRNETVLLLGPSGCGKHLLIDYCLSRLRKENESSNPNLFLQGEFIEIHLDGDYIENDDDAFRIIARHLTSPVMRHKRMKNAQFKNMEFLETVLQEAQICGVPMLFILDNFSSFCHQSKQTLLYTLLDMCSNKGVQMGVIGIDRDCSILEHLEKRIQSRFSQKQIIVNLPSPEDLAIYLSSKLYLPGKDRQTIRWNSAIKKSVEDSEIKSVITSNSILLPLSYHILYFSSHYDVFLISRDIDRVLLHAVITLPENLSDVTMQFWTECFLSIRNQITLDRNFSLSYLGVNDAALMIAAKHYEERSVHNYCFLDLFEVFNKWVTSSHNFSFSSMTENVAWQSFQILLQFGVIQYVSCNSSVGGSVRNENTKRSSTNTVFRNGNEMNSPIMLTIPPDEIDRNIKRKCMSCPTVLEYWALKKVD